MTIYISSYLKSQCSASTLASSKPQLISLSNFNIQLKFRRSLFLNCEGEA
jgi:hypothetical protein